MTEIPDDRLTLTEAAERLGITEPDLRRLLKDVAGIEAVRTPSRWQVNPDSLPDGPMPTTRHRPIILRNSNDGWLESSTNPGDRAPARERPPEPIEEAPWRIIKPADA